jgi:hypothetical protein
METLIAGVLIFVAGAIFAFLFYLMVFVVVELPRMGVQRLWTLATGQKPRNLRSLNAATCAIALLVGLVFIFIPGLAPLGYLNFLVAFTSGVQVLFNQQLEERAIHHYKCPTCSVELLLSDLPLGEGDFLCKRCGNPLQLVWGSDQFPRIFTVRRTSLSRFTLRRNS